MLALMIAESRSDCEFGAAWQTHQQRAHPALVPTGSGLVTHDDCFRIMKRLYL